MTHKVTVSKNGTHLYTRLVERRDISRVLQDIDIKFSIRGFVFSSLMTFIYNSLPYLKVIHITLADDTVVLLEQETKETQVSAEPITTVFFLIS